MSRRVLPVAARAIGRHHDAGRAMIGGIAKFERELIRARTGEGIRRAKANGVHMGRPSKLTKHQQREALKRLDGPDVRRVSHDDFSPRRPGCG